MVGKIHHESKLTADFISRAKPFWIKEIQQVHLHSELIMLKKSQVPWNHVLNMLTAYMSKSHKLLKFYVTQKFWI